jgi:hypothetical protein
MNELGRMRRRSEGATRDLWPRFWERMAADDHVELRLPAVTWREIVAGATVVGILMVAPEPARLLTACGLL